MTDSSKDQLRTVTVPSAKLRNGGKPARIRDNHPPLALRIEDIAKLFSCGIRTVWRRVADGTLPRPIKLGGSTRWDADEVYQAWDNLKRSHRVK